MGTPARIIAVTLLVSLSTAHGELRQDEHPVQPQQLADRSRDSALVRPATTWHHQESEQPGERDRHFLQTRSPDRVSPLRMSWYLDAIRHMDRMPQYFSATDERLPSRSDPTALTSSQAQPLRRWTWLGPGNVGGRTRALLIHPTTPWIMYAAGVSGGVWKTTDSGASWNPIADLIANIAVCSMVMDPQNPSVIYAGTGEGFGSADAVRGAGIFKTTNGGRTWTHLSATNHDDFHYVNKLLVSPLSSNRIYAATRSGVWRSTDAGTSWRKVFTTKAANGSGTMDLAIRSDRPTDVVIATDGNFAQAAIYRNVDAGGGGVWTLVYTEANMGRTSLAIAPSNQNVVYALASSLEGAPRTYGLLVFLRSTDGGATWQARVRNTNTTGVNACLLSTCDCSNLPLYGQGFYDNVVAVDPLDADRVWAGGIALFRSDDGGASWGLASYSGDQLHPDDHVIAFHPDFDGAANQRMFVGNDGGIYRTDNARTTTSAEWCGSRSAVDWVRLNNGYGVTQFYHGLPYPDGTTYFGGTQDNGVIWGTDAEGPNAWSAAPPPSPWKGGGGGDGWYVAINPQNVNELYVRDNYNLRRTSDAGLTWTYGTPGITESLYYFTPLVMDPSDPSTLWVGAGKPWRTTDGGITWSQAGAAVSDYVTAIAIAPSDRNSVFMGLSTGKVVRSTNALKTGATSVWAETQLPSASCRVSSLAVDPADKRVVYATCSTFGVPHVWKSVDGGVSFKKNSGSGNTGIPDVPVHTIVIDPGSTSRIYIGSDLGVFTSVDGGASWYVESTGFANVRTDSLSIAGSRLFAFTHGRGAYRVSLQPLPRRRATRH